VLGERLFSGVCSGGNACREVQRWAFRELLRHADNVARWLPSRVMTSVARAHDNSDVGFGEHEYCSETFVSVLRTQAAAIWPSRLYMWNPDRSRGKEHDNRNALTPSSEAASCILSRMQYDKTLRMTSKSSSLTLLSRQCAVTAHVGFALERFNNLDD